MIKGPGESTLMFSPFNTYISCPPSLPLHMSESFFPFFKKEKKIYRTLPWCFHLLLCGLRSADYQNSWAKTVNNDVGKVAGFDLWSNKSSFMLTSVIAELKQAPFGGGYFGQCPPRPLFSALCKDVCLLINSDLICLPSVVLICPQWCRNTVSAGSSLRYHWHHVHSMISDWVGSPRDSSRKENKAASRSFNDTKSRRGKRWIFIQSVCLGETDHPCWNC